MIKAEAVVELGLDLRVRSLKLAGLFIVVKFF